MSDIMSAFAYCVKPGKMNLVPISVTQLCQPKPNPNHIRLS
jgi:hypothetical protein